jgi:ATP-binding protein involved in chromosome partitioning
VQQYKAAPLQNHGLGSLIDARKAAAMFAKVNIPVGGVVENMAWFECAHGEKYFIFGDGGGAREAERLGVPFQVLS